MSNQDSFFKIGVVVALVIAIAALFFVGSAINNLAGSLDGDSTLGGSTSDNFLVGQEIVGNDDGGDNDSRIEGDTDANLFFVNAGTDSVGISSTTPTGLLGIGDGGATSTISAGRFCLLAEDEAGRAMWVTLAISGNVVFATSTTPCNQ